MTRGKTNTLAPAISIHSDMSRRWVCLPSRLESNARPSGALLFVTRRRPDAGAVSGGARDSRRRLLALPRLLQGKERRQRRRVGVGLAVSRLPPSPRRLRRRIGVRVHHARVYVVERRTMSDGRQSPQPRVPRIAAFDAGTLADGGKIAWAVDGLGHFFSLPSPLALYVTCAAHGRNTFIAVRGGDAQVPIVRRGVALVKHDVALRRLVRIYGYRLRVGDWRVLYDIGHQSASSRRRTLASKILPDQRTGRQGGFPHATT